ncbi:unnamed protein product, partial [Symbiodinium sp. KB8]
MRPLRVRVGPDLEGIDPSTDFAPRDGLGSMVVPEALSSVPREHLYVHNISGIMHASLDLRKLLCGRALNGHYSCVTDVTAQVVGLAPVCEPEPTLRYLRLPAMATSELDSEVEFKRRALQLGVTASNIDSLIASGFKTFGQFAFSVPYQPGSADESPLVELLTSSLSGEPEADQLSCLRRLFWESHGLAVRDLRLRQEHGADAVLKKLPTSERVARAEAQKKRLNGLTWSPETEPSHQLVDRFVSMVEEQTVIYIRPELCASRAQETLQIKQAKTFSFGSDGQLRLSHKVDDLECSTAGEWKLRMALQRKSLAMDLAGLVSFQVGEEWHTYLFTVREREVPKNMKQVSLQQILDADKRLWILLAEEVRGKIVPRPGADPVCDAIIRRLSSSNDVLSYLTPQQEIRQPSIHRWEPYTPRGRGGKGKGKDEDKDKNKGSESSTSQLSIPEGAHKTTSDGKPLCFLFRVPVAATRIVLLPNPWLFTFFGKIGPSRKRRETCPFRGSLYIDEFGLSFAGCDGALASGFRKIGWDSLAIDLSSLVRNENKLFEFCVRVLRWALDRHAFVVLHTSFMWQCLESPDQGAVHGAFNPSSVPLRTSVSSGLPFSDNSGFNASLSGSAPSDVSGLNASPPEQTTPGKGVTVGIYATPLEFVDRARALQHLMAGPSVVSDSFKKALFANLTRSPAEIVRARASFMDKVTALVEKLRPAEDALHASLPSELQQVLKGKRLLLFKELLEMYNYDDPQVWQLLRDGPSLTGCQDHPPYADHRYRPASISTKQLESEATWRRRAISTKTLSPQDAAILTELGASEVQAGFVSGPFRSEQEVSAALGRSDWVATPRFVLLQGAKAKPRVIDDCRASGLNSSFSSTERLRLQDLDYVVAMVRLAGRMSCKHSIRMDLSTGEVLCGDRVLPPGSEWLGRCVDLAKAYKQMAVPRAQPHLVVLCHHDEDGAPLYYISESLPFGAEGSVYGFVRTSRALSFLINEAILVPSSVYFDDFPALSPGALAKSATDSISFLLSALGWKFSTDPEKAKDFAPQFDVLGCSLDLSSLVGPFGFLEVKNKPNRVSHITDLLDELGSGRGDYKLIPVIKGQLNFASNFVMGRAISPLSRSLSSATSGDIRSLCDKVKELLANSKPRKVSWHSPDSPILLFTDAAFEKGRATVGAVVIDTLGGPADIYDGELPGKLVSSWQRYADEQIICQAELAAA